MIVADFRTNKNISILVKEKPGTAFNQKKNSYIWKIHQGRIVTIVNDNRFHT